MVERDLWTCARTLNRCISTRHNDHPPSLRVLKENNKRWFVYLWLPTRLFIVELNFKVCKLKELLSYYCIPSKEKTVQPLLMSLTD